LAGDCLSVVNHHLKVVASNIKATFGCYYWTENSGDGYFEKRLEIGSTQALILRVCFLEKINRYGCLGVSGNSIRSTVIQFIG